jgi:hypothetical protein
MPRCGSGHDHPDAAAVRACYAKKYGGFKSRDQLERFDDAKFTREIQRREREEDERVAAFKMARDGFSLGEDAAAEIRRAAVATRNGFASRSDVRDRRLGATDLRRPGAVDLAPGGYAIASRTGHNDLDFWWVDRPEEGKWAGWTFVERVIGGHENQRVSLGESVATLGLLAALSPVDAEEAQALFGQEIGRCYVCGRTLTDEASRAAGIGPVCASR